jgi:hypothetical protein
MIDPDTVTSSLDKVRDKISNLKMIYSGGERQEGNPFSGWSMAELEENDEPFIAIRWTIEPTGWFVLPMIVGKSAQDALFAHLYSVALGQAQTKEVE